MAEGLKGRKGSRRGVAKIGQAWGGGKGDAGRGRAEAGAGGGTLPFVDYRRGPPPPPDRPRPPRPRRTPGRRAPRLRGRRTAPPASAGGTSGLHSPRPARARAGRPGTGQEGPLPPPLGPRPTRPTPPPTCAAPAGRTLQARPGRPHARAAGRNKVKATVTGGGTEGGRCPSPSSPKTPSSRGLALSPPRAHPEPRPPWFGILPLGVPPPTGTHGSTVPCVNVQTYPQWRQGVFDTLALSPVR